MLAKASSWPGNPPQYGKCPVLSHCSHLCLRWQLDTGTVIHSSTYLCWSITKATPFHITNKTLAKCIKILNLLPGVQPYHLPSPITVTAPQPLPALQTAPCLLPSLCPAPQHPQTLLGSLATSTGPAYGSPPRCSPTGRAHTPWGSRRSCGPSATSPQSVPGLLTAEPGPSPAIATASAEPQWGS